MIKTERTLFQDLSFNPAKLQPCESRKKSNQGEKEKEGFRGGKICLFRGLIGAVYKQDDDVIYEVTEHIYFLIDSASAGVNDQPAYHL